MIQPGRGAEISGLGSLGELHPSIRQKYDIEKSVAFFELDLDKLFKLARKQVKFKQLPKYPSVSRDIALMVSKGVANKLILTTIKKVGGHLVENVFLFDKYKDSQAYRIVFRDPDKTLTDEEVNNKHQEIVRSIESKLNVRVRR